MDPDVRSFCQSIRQGKTFIKTAYFHLFLKVSILELAGVIIWKPRRSTYTKHQPISSIQFRFIRVPKGNYYYGLQTKVLKMKDSKLCQNQIKY